MLLEISNISKKYGDQVVLDNVTLSYEQGNVVGLLGRNGAGKSTLMKIITGFVHPNAGTVKIGGMSVGIESSKIVGYLPEHNPLYTDMFVVEYLEFVGRIYKLQNLRARISDVVEMVGLGSEAKKKIGQLSKGYRQRVGLAAAIIHDPEIMILDEPTTGLDPSQLVEIRSLIKSLGKDRLVILSTHVMQEVEAMCDFVVMLQKGKVVFDGSKQDAISKYGTLDELFDENLKK
ncbi:MAG: ABC transporter ATP-binding protein [Paludibacteraceae bacterium]|nr:ABC transporter ATP-binding protein [Paludibacteraceae bacterium]